ncbi:MAG: dihydropteroate synthase [Anaerolineae bacterium]|nr:dihydropteroate synthase [Anaerolineae bacterium]MBL6965520.1 dihydropteroate synthase [Anaerolineales bacterium]
MLTALVLDQHTFSWGARTYVMGILNITPDSFSGDGLMSPSPTSALEQARHFITAGADILDVGGESTRPGAEPVDEIEELKRVLPVIRALAAEFSDVLISIDTYKASVAEAALEAGAHLVNDVWGLRADPELAAVVKRFNVPVILMHNRSNPKTAEIRDRLGGRYVGVEYADLLEDVKRELLESVAIARAAGIPDEKIILDPGIGFGKTIEQNLELLNRLGEIRALGYPILLGPSRKSFIGYTLDLPPDQRLEGTAATISVGITRGADIIRVHDVLEMARVAHMSDAIIRPPLHVE